MVSTYSHKVSSITTRESEPAITVSRVLSPVPGLQSRSRPLPLQIRPRQSLLPPSPPHRSHTQSQLPLLPTPFLPRSRAPAPLATHPASCPSKKKPLLDDRAVPWKMGHSADAL